jgi:microcystin-dependent protein
MPTPYGLVALHAAAPMGQEARLRLGFHGWSVCDGSPLATASYPDLYLAISTFFGGTVQDGLVYQFNLPNLCDVFLRGVDGSAGVDPGATTRTAPKPMANAGDKVGSFQAAATAVPSAPFTLDSAGDHSHQVQHVTGSETRAYYGSTQEYAEVGDNNPGAACDAAGHHSHNIQGGDAATAPTNLAMYFIIKGDLLD